MTQTVKELKDTIKTDIQFGYTPDLPALRYCEPPFNVFLWDELSDEDTLKSLLDDDVRVNGTMYTCEKYLPWYNIREGQGFMAYCLGRVDMVDKCNLPEYSVDEPLIVKGLAARVSLEGLKKLDAYYTNTVDFHRRIIQTKYTHYATYRYSYYSWFNNLSDIATISDKGMVLDPELDFSPFSWEKNTGAYKF